jgi:prophage tail gpP-like protein
MRPVGAPVPKGWKIVPYKECQLFIGETPIITGFIESVKSQVARDQHSIQVRGRDLTADLIDCPSGQGGKSYQQARFKTILDSLLKNFRISRVFESQPTHLHPAFHVNEFEGVFSALSRIAALEGLMLITDGLGRLVITRPNIKKDPEETLTRALSCEYNVDVQGRFSEYDMFIPNYAQNENSSQESKPLAVSRDKSIGRFRPFSISSDGYSDMKTAQKRVDWENAVRAAKSEKLKICLAGWQTGQGKLWEINKTIFADFPAIGVKDKFLISGVTFKLDQSGHQTELECTPAAAFQADPTLFIKENNMKDLVTKVSSQ